jgi:hypothetical protein
VRNPHADAPLDPSDQDMAAAASHISSRRRPQHPMLQGIDYINGRAVGSHRPDQLWAHAGLRK